MTADEDRKPDAPPEIEVPYGSNDVRLTGRQWIASAVLSLAVLGLLPVLWPHVEKLQDCPSYRIPCELSEDYWLFERLCRQAGGQGRTLVLGDSVIWGHYVRQEQTLSGALNALAGGRRFANLGVDGIHPAAMAGLIEHYGRGISQVKVLLHCNLLWMSSRRHDLQTRKEFPFNHPRLVPQFHPAIPCYRETISNRLAIAIERRLGLHAWTRHLRLAYLDGNDVPTWSLGHPYEDPLAEITLEVPSGRAAGSPEADAIPWTQRGIRKLDAPWVPLGESFQWRCFQRAAEVLLERGNELFVVIGPFNEHMLTPESLRRYRRREGEAVAWLGRRKIALWTPQVLPSESYADASHPLSRGYAMLARGLYENEAFARFDGRKRQETKRMGAHAIAARR